jgi:ankyrin repeat protein
VNYNSARSCFPLQAASEAGHENMVCLLLDKGAVINKVGLRDLFECDSRFALQGAATCGREAVVQLLIDKGADVNLQGLRGSAISPAVEYGQTSTVRILLANGARPGHAQLYSSLFSGYVELSRLLLDHIRDFKVNDMWSTYGTPITVACKGCREGIVGLLLEYGADVTIRGGFVDSCVEAVAGHSINCSEDTRVRILQLLLAAGADINIVRGKHGSPLHAACVVGNAKLFHRILQVGAPLQTGAGQSHSNLIERTVHGSTGCYVRHDRRTHSFYQAYCHILGTLIDRGLDVNARTAENNFALYTASASKHENYDMVEYLIKKGADVNLRGGEQGSALNTAKARGFERTVELLLSHGAVWHDE